ncbi:MAG: IclR family transcriptional regulator [Desulfocucumaceae bacterium]
MKEPRDEVRSIKRALDILEVLRVEKEPRSLAYLHKALDLPKTTLARILSTLEAKGFVERDSTLQKYTLGIKFFYYGHAVSEKLTEKQVVAPVLKRIRDSCLESVYICILHNNRRLCVDYLSGKNAVRVMTYVGDESPLYVGASGKVMLAYFTEEELDRYFRETELVPFTPNSIVSRELLVQDLKLTRQHGYAISLGEKAVGVISVSAALKDEKGKVRGSLSIAAPIERQAEVDKYIKLVTEGAAEINSCQPFRL